MKKNLLVLAIAVLLIGCSKFEEPPSDTPIRESKTRSALAAQDNPYSLTNVQMAMEKELEKKTLAGILKDAKANWKEAGA